MKFIEVCSVCGQRTQLVGEDYLSFCKQCEKVCEGHTNKIPEEEYEKWPDGQMLSDNGDV